MALLIVVDVARRQPPRTGRGDESRVRSDIDRLRERRNARGASLVETEQELTEIIVFAEKERLRIVLAMLSTTGSIIFLISVLIGCVLWTYQKYVKHLDSMKTYGFVAKYIEVEGWVRVVSVLGVLSGVFSIFVAQVMQIYQGMREELVRMNRVRTSGEDHNSALSKPNLRGPENEMA